MQPSIHELTTVISTMPFAVWQDRAVNLNRPRPDLYFHLVLRFENELSGNAERKRFEKYIIGFIRANGAAAESVCLVGGRIHLLVGLPQMLALADFAHRLKLVSRAFARRKLKAKNFVWQKEYDAFTVSPSQIERVKSYIRRQARLEKQETYSSSWKVVPKERLY